MQTIFTRIQKNWKSGLTVGLVSIPLSISLAVASQTTPIAGIITAIWAGLVASIFGGSNFNIIGPTGALSGILAAYALTHGPHMLPLLAIVTGLMIIGAYFLHLERYLVFIPASTIHGFTLGVACIIALNQLNFAFGLQHVTKHETFFENVLESLSHIDTISMPTTLVFILFLVSLFVCTQYIQQLPAVIIMTPLGILLGYLSSLSYISVTLETLGDRFGSLSFMPFLPATFSYTSTLFSSSLILALIAIIETMISARIADGMTKTRHNSRKELFALGLANITSGFAGGIPATAALARTALNVQSGATNKISATICSLVVAGISLLLLNFFSYIPLAVIAAILVHVAVRMVEAEHFQKLYEYDKTNFIISLLVAAITIYHDPIMGILIGISLSLIVFMEELSSGYYAVSKLKISENQPVNSEKQSDSDILIYSFKGQLAYINGQAHLARLERKLHNYAYVILNLADVFFIDLDGADVLNEIISLLHKHNKIVLISSINPSINELIMASDELQKLQRKGLIFKS